MLSNLKQIFRYVIILTTAVFVSYASFGQDFLWGNALFDTAGKYYTNTSVAIDRHHNIIGTGYFMPGNGHTMLYNQGVGYVIKYDSLGTMQWIRTINGNNEISPLAITVDGNDNIYIGGTFLGSSAKFTSTDSIINKNKVLPGESGFWAKYDATGNFQWAYSTNCTGSSRIAALTTDAHNNLICGGYFTDSANIGGTLLVGNGNFLLLKCSATGSIEWAKQSNPLTANQNFILALTCDATDNIFATGYFGKHLSIDTFNISDVAHNFTPFTIKLNTYGNTQWVVAGPNSGHDVDNNGGAGIAVDDAGNVYVCAQLIDTAIPFGATYHYSIVAKYGNDGSGKWEQLIGPSKYTHINGLTVGKTQCPYIAGSFWDSLTMPAYILPAADSMSGYIAKIDSGSGHVLWSMAVDGTRPNQGFSIAAATDENKIAIGGAFQSYLNLGAIHLYNPMPMSAGNWRSAYIALLADTIGSAYVPLLHERTIECKVFPNPATENVDIVFTNGDSHTITLFSETGQLLQVSGTSQKAMHMSVASLLPGIYYIVIKDNNNNIQTQKLIKR